MPERASFTTHLVDIGEDEVVKRFRSWDRGEHLREWQALTLLASYAPDLPLAPGHSEGYGETFGAFSCEEETAFTRPAPHAMGDLSL
jgi:hypothetical protein